MQNDAAPRHNVALGARTSANIGLDCQFFAEDALDGHSPVTKEFPALAEFLAFRVELRLCEHQPCTECSQRSLRTSAANLR